MSGMILEMILEMICEWRACEEPGTASYDVPAPAGIDGGAEKALARQYRCAMSGSA